MTLRARVLVPPVLTWIQRNAVAERRLKNRRELRQEGWLWWLCGHRETARVLFGPPSSSDNAVDSRPEEAAP